MLTRHLTNMIVQMVDSALPTTREFWRRKYFDATDAEASDPRPFAEVLAERKDRADDAAQAATSQPARTGKRDRASPGL